MFRPSRWRNLVRNPDKSWGVLKGQQLQASTPTDIQPPSHIGLEPLVFCIAAQLQGLSPGHSPQKPGHVEPRGVGREAGTRGPVAKKRVKGAEMGLEETEVDWMKWCVIFLEVRFSFSEAEMLLKQARPGSGVKSCFRDLFQGHCHDWLLSRSSEQPPQESLASAVLRISDRAPVAW